MKKKRTAALLLCAIMICLALVSCGRDENGVPDGMIEVGGEFTDFRLFVPDDWTQDLESGFVSAHAPDGSNVSVMTLSLGGVYSVSEEDYLIKSGESQYNGVVDYFEKEYFPTVKATFADIALTEQYTTGQTLGGEKRTCKYVYKMMMGEGIEYTIMQMLAVHGTELFIFTYTAKSEVYESHLEDVSDVVTNFIFK